MKRTDKRDNNKMGMVIMAIIRNSKDTTLPALSFLKGTDAGCCP